MAKRFQITTAAILAGGKGERLRPAVADRPKVLAPVADRPFLSRLLDQLSHAGVGKVVLCTGYLAEQVEAEFGARYGGVQLLYSPEATPLDTGGAVALALAHLGAGPVLVLNGDSYCELDYAALFRWHTWKNADATVVLTHVPDVSRFGSVTCSAEGRIVRFHEKGQQGPGWINAGVYILSPDLLKTFPAGSRWSLEREGFPRLVEQGRLYGFPGGKEFIDIGLPDSYEQAQTFFRSRNGHKARNGGGRRFVLLDRDGTVIVEKGYLSHPDGLEMIPGAVEALGSMRRMGLGLAVITNQSGLARGYFDLPRLHSIHERMRERLSAGGVELDGIYFCPHSPEEGCACRKPAPGLVRQAAADLGFDPENAFVIGDKPCDIELGRVIGATTILVDTGYGSRLSSQERASADYLAADLKEAAQMIEKLVSGEPARADSASSPRAGKNTGAAEEKVKAYLLDAAEVYRRAAGSCPVEVAAATAAIAASIRSGGKVLICGNGGSAAQSQHMAAELVSTLNKDVRRAALPAIALTTDTSIITAIANDFGFAGIFARQVEALGRSGDVLLAISTSGGSENALRAAETARRNGMKVIALVGAGQSPLAAAADIAVHVASENTQHIQEVHQAIEHLLCALVEDALFEGGGA